VRAAPVRVTFAAAVRRAAASATNAVLALEEVRRAEALLIEGRSASLPLLVANGGYTILDSPRGQFTPQHLWTGNVAGQVPLVAPSRWATWAAASENVQVARASEQDVRRVAVLTAARAYLAILAQKRLVDVSRSARDIAKARFDFAHARRAGGIGNAVDELRAEQQLATSEVQLQTGEVGLLRAQEALGTAVGADAPLDAAEEPTFTPEPGAGVAEAEARRLDLKAARARLRGAEIVSGYSWTDWLPTLLATGQAFYNGPATVTNPQTGWQVQFLLSLPIFEGGLRYGVLREREAVEREARVQADATLRLVHSDVRLAGESLARQEASLASARVAAERARSVLQLTIEAYRAGATNDLDVTTAQQQSRDADLGAVIAEDGVRQARLDLLAALGQFP
jgi:outer membrane protein TolC